MCFLDQPVVLPIRLLSFRSFAGAGVGVTLGGAVSSSAAPAAAEAPKAEAPAATAAPAAEVG